MTTHYQPTEQGGMSFTSTRRPGEVRIPNYVYDIWMPLLGIEAIGVYAVYCRLEREGTVKAMSQQRLAQEMRIGTGKLEHINDLLQRYGFINVRKPQSFEKLMHYTTEITVHDPPKDIPAETIEELKHPKGYEVLCPWLTEPPKTLPSDAETTNESCGNQSGSDANVAPSGVAPSVVEEEGGAAAPHAPVEDSWPAEPAEQEPEPPPNPAQERLARMRAKFGETPGDMVLHCLEAKEAEGVWTVPSYRDLSPQCAAYRRVYEFSPKKYQRKTIDESVAEDEKSLQFWEEVCQAWADLGWNPTNVKGMLDFYVLGTVPTTKPQGGRNGGASTPRQGDDRISNAISTMFDENGRRRKEFRRG